MSISRTTGGLIETLANSDNLLEGFFWSGWCGLNISQWYSARNEKKEAEKLPEGAEKADKIWVANKKFTLASFSFVSGISMVTSWLENINAFSLGFFSPFIGAMGYAGSSVVSTSNLWDTVQEFVQGIENFQKAITVDEQRIIVLKQIDTLIKIAFYVSIAAWGALGALHTFFGGNALFFAMDTCLYYGLLSFVAMLASTVLTPIIKKSL